MSEHDKRFWFKETKVKTCKDCYWFEPIVKHDTKEGVMCGQCIEYGMPEDSDCKICLDFG